jgi:tRNA threonylcarbamoyladenosine biosynthesis protein TsaE
VSARVYRTSSEEETIALGRRLAEALGRPTTILLIGELGAGKTTLAKGIIAGLRSAAEDEVSSPTFTLIHEYGNDVYHIDLYRLDTPAEITTLGLEDLLERDAVVLVEWGERFPRLWPEDHIEIRINVRDDSREFAVTGLK